MSTQIVHCIRLHPNQDLKSEIMQFCLKEKIVAGCVLSAVGSLNNLKIRLAGTNRFLEKKENFEIVSMTGTISTNGCHIHLSAANSIGEVVGGHLVENNLIYTTCEIVFLELKDFQFNRELDPTTTFNELKIYFTKS